jgi:hypothetical protein
MAIVSNCHAARMKWIAFGVLVAWSSRESSDNDASARVGAPHPGHLSGDGLA